MKSIIEAMLRTQDLVNQSSQGEDWRNKGNNWHLAIQQECAEGIDHIGWKWWAKQEPNITAAQMEVVDVTHFVLSAELVAGAEQNQTLEEIAHYLYTDYKARLLSFTVDSTEYNPQAMEIIPVLQLLSVEAGLGHTSFGLTSLAGELLGMGMKDLYTLYTAKATLNIFRQKNGYKEGKYNKTWLEPVGESIKGCEDNDVMQTYLIPKIDFDSPEAAHNLYHLLDDYYTKYIKQ